jgi:hypothetical protein
MRTVIFSLGPPNPYVISGTSTRKKDNYVLAETCQYCNKKNMGRGLIVHFLFKNG